MERVLFTHKKSIDADLVKFLDYSLNQLTNEFILYHRMIPKYEDIFCAEERTLLGLYSNAIVRNSEEYQTYQEYGVYGKVKKNPKKFHGRADMYVITPEFNILIEGKKWNSNNLEMGNRKLKNELETAWEQAKDYYKAEKYLKLYPYLMSIVFDYFKSNPATINDVLNYDVENTRDGIDYYSIFQHEHDVLMVYGRVK